MQVTPIVCDEDCFEQVGRCPVCGAARAQPLHAGLTDNTFFALTAVCDLYACPQCGSGFLSPRLRPQHIGAAYSRYYTHARSSGYLGDAAGAARGGPHALRRAAFARLVPMGRIRAQFMPRAQRLAGALAAPFLARALDKALRGLPRDRTGDVLDVGFGNGDFLDLAALAGWKGSGVDPDPVVVENARARGLDVRQGGLADVHAEARRFDFISMSHTIEHVHDPRAEIRMAWQMLRPGGLLYIETPNIGSSGHARYGRNWRGLEPPRHLVLFSWAALERVLEQEGFRIRKRIRKLGPIARIAAQSEAIAQGRDPSAARVRARHRIRRLLGRLELLLRPRRSEFITLLAQRPEDPVRVRKLELP